MDLTLVWPLSLILFGRGHPAIDFLLLLAVTSDMVGMVVLAVFYTDPLQPVEPKYLCLVALAMFLAYCLRKLHFRKSRMTHQSWAPYLVVGFLSWLGLLWAHLHPALALVPVIPFMPGPTYKELDHLDEEVEAAIEGLALASDDGSNESGKASVSTPEPLLDRVTACKSKAIHKHHEFSRGRGISIQGSAVVVCCFLSPL